MQLFWKIRKKSGAGQSSCQYIPSILTEIIYIIKRGIEMIKLTERQLTIILIVCVCVVGFIATTEFNTTEYGCLIEFLGRKFGYFIEF